VELWLFSYELRAKVGYSHFALSDQTCKVLKRPVEGAFGIIGENAGRKLPAFQMIAYAVTAYPFARTGVITAVTGL